MISSFTISQELFHLVSLYSLWPTVYVQQLPEAGGGGGGYLYIASGDSVLGTAQNLESDTFHNLHIYSAPTVCQVLCYVLGMKKSMKNKQVLCVTGAHSKAWGWELFGKTYEDITVIQRGNVVRDLSLRCRGGMIKAKEGVTS